MSESATKPERGADEWRWPRGVMDHWCPTGHAIAGDALRDRRLLWHLEMELVVSGTTETHRSLARRLSAYLSQTCEHHWHDYSGYMDIPAVWQCLWCNHVVTEKPDDLPVDPDEDWDVTP